VQVTQFGGPGLSDHADRVRHDATHDHPTPREFYARFGRVVLFCLGLALIAHVIVAVSATQ
jgi:hypothetical protein